MTDLLFLTAVIFGTWLLALDLRDAIRTRRRR